jgi:hydrogenase maturation factor
MCLAVPAKIIRTDGSGQGTASYMGSEVQVNLVLVLDEKEARETLRLFKELAGTAHP